jgi:hypothetical protein
MFTAQAGYANLKGGTLVEQAMKNADVSETVSRRAGLLFDEYRHSIFCRTDRLFMVLMSVQWVAAVAAALWITPRTWAGQYSHVHIHVWAAIFLGGAITIFPVWLGRYAREKPPHGSRSLPRKCSCRRRDHGLDGLSDPAW